MSLGDVLEQGIEPYLTTGRPQAMTSSDGRKRLIYLNPDRALPQFSRPSELLNTSNHVLTTSEDTQLDYVSQCDLPIDGSSLTRS